ncbi:hypothetical protein LTR02_012254 [Friedmanniomyces endolithicus]|nr:hypothetical protein LTR02_012254 [Friedmanniomyces endolithicus]
MNESSESDIIEGGGGERGERQAGSSSPASAASAVANAAPDGGGGTEWQMVTRAKAKGSGLKKVGAFNIEVASAAERKRKAESSVDDRLLALTQTIKELVDRPEGDDRNSEADDREMLMEAIKAQADEIKTLKSMMADNVRHPSRSAAMKQSLPRVQDERAVPVDIGRYKGAKNNFAAIKEKLQESLKVNKVTENLTVKYLRPGPGERIDVVFENREEANKAKLHTRWLTSGTCLVHEWQQRVLDEEINDGKTLKNFLLEFRSDHKCEAAECTAMKATWLSKVDVTKKVGSLVSAGLPAITVGGSTVTANVASEYVVGSSRTLQPGGSAVIVSGSTFSLAPSGTAIVVNGQTSPVAEQSSVGIPATGALSVGNSAVTYSQLSQGGIVVGSQTLTAGGSAITVAGQQVSLASSGAVEVDGSPAGTIAPTPLATGIATGVITNAGQIFSYSELSEGGVVISSLTLAPGSSAATFGSQQVSVASNGVVEIDGSPAATIVPIVTIGAQSAGTIVVGRHTRSYSELDSSGIIIGSQTLSAGGSAATVAGSLVSLAPNGVGKVDGTQSATIAIQSRSTGVVTVGSESLSYAFSGAAAIVDSQRLAPGSTLVVDGATLTLAPSGSGIEVLPELSRDSSTGLTSSTGSATISGAAQATSAASYATKVNDMQLYAVAVIVLGLAAA